MKLHTGLIILAVFSAVTLTAAGIIAENTDNRWGNNKPCYGPGYGSHGSMHGIYGFGETDFLKKDLNLSDDQVKKISTINSKFRGKYDKNRGNRDSMWETRKEHKKAIDAVLTKEQKSKLDRSDNYCCGWNRDSDRGVKNRGWHHRGRGY